jgi:hypothetical protein
MDAADTTAEPTTCKALKANGQQCSRKNKFEGFCATHFHKHSYGIVDNVSHKVHIHIQFIKGIPFYFDTQNRMIAHEFIHSLIPSIIPPHRDDAAGTGDDGTGDDV